jgi:hypothetical protein
MAAISSVSSGVGRHDLHIAQAAEHLGFHRDSRAEQWYPPKSPPLHLIGNRSKKADQRQRRNRRQFVRSHLRRKRRDRGNLRSSASQLAKESGKILRQLIGLAGSGVAHHTAHIPVHHQDPRRQAEREVRLNQCPVIKDPGPHAETGNQARRTRLRIVIDHRTMILIARQRS